MYDPLAINYLSDFLKLLNSSISKYWLLLTFLFLCCYFITQYTVNIYTHTHTHILAHFNTFIIIRHVFLNFKLDSSTLGEIKKNEVKLSVSSHLCTPVLWPGFYFGWALYVFLWLVMIFFIFCSSNRFSDGWLLPSLFHSRLWPYLIFLTTPFIFPLIPRHYTPCADRSHLRSFTRSFLTVPLFSVKEITFMHILSAVGYFFNVIYIYLDSCSIIVIFSIIFFVLNAGLRN